MFGFKVKIAKKGPQNFLKKNSIWVSLSAEFHADLKSVEKVS
jgi:hypothetical protein